jgi:23S rRNA pseudouridine2605 synthase
MTESDPDTPDAESPDAAAAPREGERIAKRLARAGLCSRRDAERWIAEGRVTVDGRKLTSPAVNVTEASRILVDGQPIPEKTPTRLWRYHKPRGLLTTNRDPEGRRTIFDELPEALPRVITIGRLDYNSEGLLLLTNDGELARRLELPATAWSRRYRVRVNGDVDPAALTGLAKGVTIEGVRYGAIQAQLDRQQGDNAWITMALTEGKNREVRRICEHLGWQVSRLIRVAYGPFQLGLLEPGGVEEVSPRVVKEQVKSGDGAATVAEKRRLREQAHDEKRRQKREEKRGEKQGSEPKKPRPGKREREARWVKPGEERRDREARLRHENPRGADRHEPRAPAKPFAKGGERPSGSSGRGRDERRAGGHDKPRFEARDDVPRGRRDQRRERSHEAREGRSFEPRGESRKDAFAKPGRPFRKYESHRDRNAREEGRGGKGEREAKRTSPRGDRTASHDERRDQAGSRDARAPRGRPDGKKDHRDKPDRRGKGGHRGKPGPGHAHRRRPS